MIELYDFDFLVFMTRRDEGEGKRNIQQKPLAFIQLCSNPFALECKFSPEESVLNRTTHVSYCSNNSVVKCLLKCSVKSSNQTVRRIIGFNASLNDQHLLLELRVEMRLGTVSNSHNKLKTRRTDHVQIKLPI